MSQSDSSRSPKSTPVIQYSAEVQKVIDLTVERNQRRAAEKAERRRKWGRRQSYPHMAFQEWKRQFDGLHLIDILARLGNQQPSDDPYNFKTGGVGLTVREHRVMLAAISWHMRPQAGRGALNSAKLARKTAISPKKIPQVVNALGEAGLIVNLAGDSAPNLAPNPILGFWDLRKLKELRKVRTGAGSLWKP